MLELALSMLVLSAGPQVAARMRTDAPAAADHRDPAALGDESKTNRELALAMALARGRADPCSVIAAVEAQLHVLSRDLALSEVLLMTYLEAGEGVEVEAARIRARTIGQYSNEISDARGQLLYAAAAMCPPLSEY